MTENETCIPIAIFRIKTPVAFDCEFVGVGPGGVDDMIGRVSIVDELGHVLLDYYVRPTEQIVDYRTRFSGILPGHLSDDSAKEFDNVRTEVMNIMKDRIVVGHDPVNDWKVLKYQHPQLLIRDTSLYEPFQRVNRGRRPSLKKLAAVKLGILIQNGEHDSVVDARTTMRLYQLVKNHWEKLYNK